MNYYVIRLRDGLVEYILYTFKTRKTAEKHCAYWNERKIPNVHFIVKSDKEIERDGFIY